MNYLKSLMHANKITVDDLASGVDVDPIEIGMFINGKGITPFNTIFKISQFFDVSVQDIIPFFGVLLNSHGYKDITDIDSDVLPDWLVSDNVGNVLMQNLIDPDLEEWRFSITSISGHIRKYKVSSIDREKIITLINESKDVIGYFVFNVLGRTLIVKKDSVASFSFDISKNVIPFSTEEDGNHVVILSKIRPHPINMFVNADILIDQVVEGPEERILNYFVDQVKINKFENAFLYVEGNDSNLYINMLTCEIMEIPIGLLDYSIYLLDGYTVKDVELYDMIPLGQA